MATTRRLFDLYGMTKRRSTTRNHNHDDATSIRKRIKICDNCGLESWSDLNHDVLFMVMTQLGVIDFVSFSGVCKSWRSLALSNRTKFMASRPPMFIRFSHDANKDACYLTDFEGRMFKTIIPHLVGRTCLGSTCGYLILFGGKDSDIWLVNLITRHELHFPCVPFSTYSRIGNMRGILVFSPSIYGWVFVLADRSHKYIWYSIVGKGTWDHVLSTFQILNLHAFKGKIYIVNYIPGMRFLTELRFNSEGPELNLSKLKFKNNQSFFLSWDLLSSDEKLYLIEYDRRDQYKVHELDVDEMKWVSHEKTKEEYAFFISDWGQSSAFKQDSLADPSSQYGRYVNYKKNETGRFFIANMWYSPRDCFVIV